MTQLIALFDELGIFLATDRRTTQITTPLRLHDPDANKTVIYMASDAVVGIAYTGDAYVGGLPTDEWIAAQLFELHHPGEELPRDSFAASFDVGRVPTLRKSLKALTARIEEARADITILVAGLGWTPHKKFFQVGWRWGLSTPPFGVLRYKRRNPSWMMTAGQLSEPAVARVWRRTKPTGPADSNRAVAERMAMCIHNIGGQNSTVGKDAAIAWFEPLRVTMLFAPSATWAPPPHSREEALEGTAIATPWIITPAVVSCPLLNQSRSSLHVGAWTFAFDTTAELYRSQWAQVIPQPRMTQGRRLKTSTLFSELTYPAPPPKAP